MRAFCEKAVNLLQMRRVDYGDVRMVRLRRQSIEIKNGAIESVTYEEEEGFGVRVLVNGAWGFAASNQATPDEMTRVVGAAIEIARASGTVLDRHIQLTPARRLVDSYTSACRQDPFAVPLPQKLDLLMRARRSRMALTRSSTGAKWESSPSSSNISRSSSGPQHSSTRARTALSSSRRRRPGSFTADAKASSLAASRSADLPAGVARSSSARF